ncbi:phosphoethanolamine transferase CptA [Endozoicomonas numazuensis]|uniref:phosphoethanolamine transferase CptA n=1 Tax=Endozoicomonas numazuensis TaxID=1137799 RepID=UPI00054EA195|nr:phosphoethanolamine transferase CptA [Endozoicomonas numazuensis]
MNTIINFQRKHPLLSIYLFLVYFSLVPQILVAITSFSGITGIRDTLLMTTIWLVPFVIWPRQTAIISAFLGFLLGFLSLGSLGYWLIYKQEMSQSVFFIVLESNVQEMSEFISSYMRWWYPLVFIAYLIPPLIFWSCLRKLDFQIGPKLRSIIVASAFLVIVTPVITTTMNKDLKAGIRHLGDRLEPTTPWNMVIGYLKYRDQLADMQKLLNEADKLPPLDHLTESNSSQPKTVVLVIGESENRQRMSLYGYPRKTTPLLDEMYEKQPDSLYVFRDVVTPRPYTIEALQLILSFGDSTHPEAATNAPNLLMMMKQAGYHITWITNQQTQTKRNTMLTTLSQMADKQIYLNNNRRQDTDHHDEVVLTPFENALKSHAGEKKMIVVHLIGSHRKYNYRYPKSYEVYTDRNQMPDWVPEEDVDPYNNYDNSVRYNDMIVSSLIQDLDHVGESASLLYLSDHGEEVYDTADAIFSGRNEADPTPAMYTVPFLIWVNDKYKTQQDTSHWEQYLDRPYSSTDLIYTWADLVGLDFDQKDTSRSILSENFHPSPRWIGDPLMPKSLRTFDSISNQDQP